MVDKVFVGTVPSGHRFFAVEREGRKMPLLNGAGEVAFWSEPETRTAEFSRVLRAMDNPGGLKDVAGSRC